MTSPTEDPYDVDKITQHSGGTAEACRNQVVELDTTTGGSFELNRHEPILCAVKLRLLRYPSRLTATAVVAVGVQKPITSSAVALRRFTTRSRSLDICATLQRPPRRKKSPSPKERTSLRKAKQTANSLPKRTPKPSRRASEAASARRS